MIAASVAARSGEAPENKKETSIRGITQQAPVGSMIGAAGAPPVNCQKLDRNVRKCDGTTPLDLLTEAKEMTMGDDAT
jgi:hypothetical protein